MMRSFPSVWATFSANGNHKFELTINGKIKEVGKKAICLLNLVKALTSPSSLPKVVPGFKSRQLTQNAVTVLLLLLKLINLIRSKHVSFKS